MDIAARIGKMGFRRWYERQLIDSHLSLTTCFLAGITIVACMEEVRVTELNLKQLLLVATIAAATVLTWYSWRRYITVLERAETYGSHSNCPACQTYGRFEILAAGHVAEGPYLDPQASPLPYPWLRVRCRKCSNVWRMPE